MTEAPFLLFQSLAVSKTTTIEEVVATNYGSWRSLLNAIKEVQREENSKFSKLNVEKLANLSVPLDAWGTRQLKERSPMFSDEFQRFVSCEEIVKSLVEDLGNLGNGSGENNENLNCGGVGKLVKDTLSSKAQTPTEPPPSSPPIVRKKQSKAVMIEIPIDGECQLDDEKEIEEEEEKEEEEEDVFKVSGRVQNTPPQQQQQQHRAAAPQHTRFDSSPESEGGIFEDGEAAEEEEEEEEEEEDILFDTPAAPRQRRDGSMPPPLEAVTVMKPRRESVALTPKQVYESAERLKRLASEKLQKFSVEKQRYGDEEDGLTEGTTTTTMEEAHAAFYQEQVINYLEEFEAVLEKIKGQVAKIKNAPLSLAMAETISVELEIESSIKDIRAEIQAHKK